VVEKLKNSREPARRHSAKRGRFVDFSEAYGVERFGGRGLWIAGRLQPPQPLASFVQLVILLGEAEAEQVFSAAGPEER
jgi:hypothetical protein